MDWKGLIFYVHVSACFKVRGVHEFDWLPCSVELWGFMAGSKVVKKINNEANSKDFCREFVIRMKLIQLRQ